MPPLPRSGPYSIYLPQQFRFRIPVTCDLLDFPVTLFDLFRQRFHFFRHRQRQMDNLSGDKVTCAALPVVKRLQRIPQIRRQFLQLLDIHLVGIPRCQPFARGFRQSPRRVHQPASASSKADRIQETGLLVPSR
jgi:hypothetical protein